MRALGRRARCVFAAVDFASDEVADFRRRFDSLYGKCPPHVTLAFTFVSDVADGEIVRILEAARPRGAFDVALLSPQFEDGYVLLLVDRPDPWFASIHLTLSTLLGARSTKAYRPHVTVGRGLESAPVSAMATLASRQQGRINRIVLEEIQEDESSRALHEIVLTPEAPIHVVSYDPAWITSFEHEKAILEELLAPWKRGPIEHVGSTAVAGLCAKPVIDVMVGVPSLAEAEPAKEVLRANGYQYGDRQSDSEHWFFCKPSFESRTHHLHLVPYGSAGWQVTLRFRDILRSDPAIAAQYAAVKHDLAKKFQFDREAYTHGKAPFITRTLESAR